MQYLTLYDVNKDYYIPPSKEELIKKLEFYKRLFKGMNLGSQFEKYEIKMDEYLHNLIDLKLSSLTPSLYETLLNDSGLFMDIAKYNIWYRTKNLVESLNNSRVSFTKAGDEKAIVKVSQTEVAEIILMPERVSFAKPNITVHCYETECVKDKIGELRKKRNRLKYELIKCKTKELYSKLNDSYLDEIDSVLIRHMEVEDELVESKNALLTYKENQPLYNDPLYREVAYALLKEYQIPNEIGKTNVKSLSWITIKRESH